MSINPINVFLYSEIIDTFYPSAIYTEIIDYVYKLIRDYNVRFQYYPKRGLLSMPLNSLFSLIA